VATQNILDDSFMVATLFGKPVLCSQNRINPYFLPQGLFSYDIRYDDEHQGCEIEVADVVYMNYWLTIITKQKLIHEYNGYTPISPSDIIYQTDLRMNISEYERIVI
jgi:hypothetical protein